jgi:hypothetical protein
MKRRAYRLAGLVAGCILAQSLFVPAQAYAGGRFFRRRPAVVVAPTQTVVVSPVQTVVSRPTNVPRDPILGTFYPTPYMTVRGNMPTGGGYSPLGIGGEDSSLDVYGPLSSLRSVAAPIVTYSRGYNGAITASEGTTFTTPFLPSASPAIYPTRGQNFYGFRTQPTPPQWDSPINWIDQN